MYIRRVVSPHSSLSPSASLLSLHLQFPSPRHTRLKNLIQDAVLQDLRYRLPLGYCLLRRRPWRCFQDSRLRGELQRVRQHLCCVLHRSSQPSVQCRNSCKPMLQQRKRLLLRQRRKRKILHIFTHAVILTRLGCPRQHPELRSHLVNSLLSRELQIRMPNCHCPVG